MDQWNDVKVILPENTDGICPRDYVLVAACNEGAGPRPLYALARRKEGKWEILGDEGVHSCTGSYAMTSEEISHWKVI